MLFLTDPQGDDNSKSARGLMFKKHCKPARRTVRSLEVTRLSASAHADGWRQGPGTSQIEAPYGWRHTQKVLSHADSPFLNLTTQSLPALAA